MEAEGQLDSRETPRRGIQEPGFGVFTHMPDCNVRRAYCGLSFEFMIVDEDLRRLSVEGCAHLKQQGCSIGVT